MSKYKYYFRKPKSEIGKDIFKLLLITGGLALALTSSPSILPNFLRRYPRWQKYPRKKVTDTFSRFKAQDLIRIEKRNRQIYISLTEKGRCKAGFMQINDLKIKKPRRWDHRWRLVMFDIAELKKIHREAFRGKLKELGFRPFQKSVWLHPYNCRAEVALLRNFFGLGLDDIKLVEAVRIDTEKNFKTIFKL